MALSLEKMASSSGHLVESEDDTMRSESGEIQTKEQEKVSRTGCLLQERWKNGPETLSLLQFVEKYSKSLPAQVIIEKGHYGSNDPETLGSQEKLIISFVKSRKVLNIVTSTKQKFTLPLGSAVQLRLLYNPEGNEEKARKGYKFQSVGHLIKKFPANLPRVIYATKAYTGDDKESTVRENEFLVVESYDMQTKRLKVKSHDGRNPTPKFLPDQCKGYFTTDPSKVCLYVSDIDKYIGTPLSILELQAILDMSKLAVMPPGTQIDKSLSGVVTLSGFVTERSLIGKRIEENGIPSAQPKTIEIPVTDDLHDVEVTVTQINMTEKYSPSTTLDVQLESWYQEESTASQRLLNDSVRHGHEREGVDINAAYNLYDELGERPPPPETPPRNTQASSSPIRDDLFQPQQSPSKDQLDSKEDGADSAGKVKLRDVIMELSEIENLWYILGILLGIQKAKLDQLQANYGSGPCPHGRCLIETICLWQDNHENATWSSLVQALYSMQKEQLAKRVADKHKVMLEALDPRKFPQDQFTEQLKEFIPEERLSEISSRQRQMQEQDQRLSKVQEQLEEHEQRMEENHKKLKAIKDHLQFNERFTRMLTRETQMVQMKQECKEQLFKSPSSEGKSKDGQTYQEKLGKEIHTLHEAQENHERRLYDAHRDTMELKKELFNIEDQMEMTKKHLHRLQDQKHELTRGLREQECQLSQLITGSLKRAGSKEEDDPPRYYNIIQCDGKVEVKLHEEELTMLEQDLDRKTKEVDCLKKELKQKHERKSEVESLLARQDYELTYTHTDHDGAENAVLEKHQNDHLKTRLQIEKIDCQIQLTRALLQKKNIELKLNAVKHSLELNKKICRRFRKLGYQNSAASHRVRIRSVGQYPGKNSRQRLSSEVQRSHRTSSVSSSGTHLRRNPSIPTHSQVRQQSHQTQVAKNE